MLGHEFVFLQATFAGRAVGSFDIYELLNCLQQDTTTYVALVIQHPDGVRWSRTMKKRSAQSFKAVVHQVIKEHFVKISNELLACHSTERDL